jgi:hypothetical protein
MIGVVVRATPADALQIVRGKGDYEILEDRTPFKVRVTNVIRENDVLIGITGPVVEGPDRYRGLVATLLTRAAESHWETDMHSAVNFKVGLQIAQRVPELPHTHPDGTRIEDYPYIVRYGTIEAGS